MSMIDKAKDFMAVVDLVAARLRGPLKTLAGLGVAFQVAMGSGQLKVPDGKWSNWVGAISIALAYFTMRGPKEAKALRKAKKLDGEPPMRDGPQ